MKYPHAKIVRTFNSSDATVQVDLLARNDGLFEFRGYTRRRESGGPNEGDYYWSPTTSSGVYASVDEAEKDALSEAAKSKSGH